MEKNEILDKVILGINDSHDSSACIIRNGEILCALAEERIQRVKSASGFPMGAVKACLEYCGLELSDIDYVAVAGTWGVPVNLIGLRSTCTVKNYITIQEKIRKPFFYGGKRVSLSEIFPNYVPSNNVHYPLDVFPLKETWELTKDEIAALKRARIEYIAKFLQISEDRIFTIDHHTCHAYYAYYASSFRGDKVAALTMDGGGDRIYDSVGVFDPQGGYTRVHASHDCIIGPLYKWVTLILGMRPGEHEYKLMGLAPYAKEYTKRASRQIFETFLGLNGIKFYKNPEVGDLYWHVKEALKCERFDGIAAGLQDVVETLLTSWTVNALRETGADRAVFSGGVAMNVKANQQIIHHAEVAGFYVPPGAGDESLCLGAVWSLMDTLNPTGSHRSHIQPMKNAYLGPDFSQKDVDDFMDHPIIKSQFEKLDGNPLTHTAQALMNNEIVAVCQDRMEFGPRALGHRSIIANPSSREIIKKINEAVKNRDFWMPFAPSVMAEHVDELLDNPGNMDLSCMTVCLDSKDNAKKLILAGLHAYDNTARIHSVDKERSPRYYNLLKAFYAISGIPGVVNTSLNIHGKPIIFKPREIADELLSESFVELNHLLIGDTFFRRISSS